VERRVPSQYPTIQEAIDECRDGDVVIISTGTYRGTGNREIDFRGKGITVRGIDPDNFRVVDKTVIDCEIAGRGFAFCTGEDGNSVIAGLTIVNGHSLAGGAIYCSNKSSPVIVNCVIISNSAVFGGGIACNDGSSPEIYNCTISSNSASMEGGAIYCSAGSPFFGNCLFRNNVAPTGGAISCADSNLATGNCTLSSNRASRGGGIYCYESSNVVIENGILWANTGESGAEILVGKSGGVSSLAVSYCNVQGGESAAVVEQGCTLNWGDGNFDAEPMFVTGPLGDYCLDPNSPCVDAGSDLAEDLDLEQFSTRQDGLSESGIVDIGYHYPAEPEAVAASIDIRPDVLDSDSRAQWITCHVEFPDGHNVADVDLNSLVLEYSIEAERIRANELRGDVTVEFSRSKMDDMLEPGDVTLTISGKLVDGRIFEAADVIKVID
jgi:predicted outer membrane repeat protein